MQELRIAEDQLEQSRAALAQETERFEQDRAEYEKMLAEAFGTPAQRIVAARQMFSRPGATDDDRTDALQLLAMTMRNESRRTEPVVEFTKALPPGMHELANELREMLLEHPAKLDLSRVDLHGQYWRRARMDRLIFTSADLRAVDLSGGSFVSAYFQDADLRCADLKGAALGGAHLHGADLQYADLRGTDLSQVEGLTPASVRDASHDGGTRWPATVRADELSPSTDYGDARACSRRLIAAAAPAPAAEAAAEVGATPTPAASTPPAGGG